MNRRASSCLRAVSGELTWKLRRCKVRNFIPFGLVRKRTDKLITVGNAAAAAAADDTKTDRQRQRYRYRKWSV